jgi:hypothetical protein
MKLALFGAIVAVAGLAFGVDGLVYSGGLWVAAGLIVTVILASRGDTAQVSPQMSFQDESEIGSIQDSSGAGKSGTWPGFAFMLAVGLGSMAIGIFGVGFTGDDEYLRWLPIVVGAVFTLLTLISLPVRLGKFDPEAAAGRAQAAKVNMDMAPSIEIERDSTVKGGEADPKFRLERIEELRSSGLITPQEYEAQRQRILSSI